jgi:hypothetical protein
VKLRLFVTSLFVCLFVVVAHTQQPKVIAIKAARALDVRTGAMINNAVII